MPATAIRRKNTITKANIVAMHADLFNERHKPIEPKEIFVGIMDHPTIAHARHTERFGRLMIACVRKGLIDPVEVEKPSL